MNPIENVSNFPEDLIAWEDAHRNERFGTEGESSAPILNSPALANDGDEPTEYQNCDGEMVPVLVAPKVGVTKAKDIQNTPNKANKPDKAGTDSDDIPLLKRPGDGR